jgi:2-succinyl-5-enolpyruvyl-6-hydroxy-3-cyclohexene-1-carboxylate synthase
VVVAGRHERTDGLGSAAGAFATALGWPLLADPLSGARRGAAAIAHYDGLLRDPGVSGSLTPDLVLRIGDLPVSKPLRVWLAGLDGVRQVALDPEGAWQDPASVLGDSLALDPSVALSELAANRASAVASRAGDSGEWLAQWRVADELAGEAMLGVLGDRSLSEPAVARELGVLLPSEATLFVASSMPVRDIETFWPAREDPPRVLCNRGANGIDGTVSAALGAAAHEEGPVVLLIGDVALAHDIGGLLALGRLGLKLTIVLLDNAGGGIFDFLPVAGAPMARERDAQPGADALGPGGRSDIYTRHVATPTGLDFARVAALYGLAHERPHDVEGFRASLERALANDGSMLIDVHGSRPENVALHRRVWRAVADAVSPPAAAAEPGA